MQLGPLELGEFPRVVGTITDREFFLNFKPEKRTLNCDLVEVRLDQLLPCPEWVKVCERIAAAGIAQIVTVRHSSEGGNWNGPETEREELIRQALKVAEAVDIEFKSEAAAHVASMAKGEGKACIASFHDFNGTPDARKLQDIIRQAQAYASVVKISTFIRDESDKGTHRTLLQGQWEVPLCVIGMGTKGTETRIGFPLLGSCLTYGFLDKSAAPGQLSAAELRKKIAERSETYEADIRDRLKS
jgi:3-dehydroquinate dehydratase-1